MLQQVAFLFDLHFANRQQQINVNTYLSASLYFQTFVIFVLIAENDSKTLIHDYKCGELMSISQISAFCVVGPLSQYRLKIPDRIV